MNKSKTSNDTSICFVISSPSGAGKTSLVLKALTQLPRVKKTVSHTTRAKRPGEVDTQDYHFVDHETFTRMQKANAFVEYAHVYDHMYGTSKKTIQDILDDDQDAILVIENQGAKHVVALFDRVVLIRIVPPSIEVLKERLLARESATSDDIEDRLQKAQTEIDSMDWYDHTIVNDDFDQALQALVALIASYQKGKCDVPIRDGI